VRIEERVKERVKERIYGSQAECNRPLLVLSPRGGVLALMLAVYSWQTVQFTLPSALDTMQVVNQQLI
jgi:hypothetical protein